VAGRVSRRLRQPLLLAAAVAAFVGLGAVWLWRFRRGEPLDIDEAGYLGIAVDDFRGLSDGGLTGWWDAVMAPSVQAPLTTALTTPIYLVTGPSILPAFIVPLAFGGVLLVAAYALGREVGGRRVAWLTVALTAGAPVVIMFYRSYLFPITSAATTALMLWAISRSRNFESRRWSALAGGCVGLVALSRTLTLAFIPALVVVGVIAVAAGPARGRRVLNVLLAAAVAAAVAAPWYLHNGGAVWDYLTAFGYGSARSAYGNDQSLVSLDSWRVSAQYVVATAGLPLVLLWLLAAVLLVTFVVSRWRQAGVVRTTASSARSLLMPSVVWAAWGLAALTSSGNKGTGFITPLVPALAVLTAWAIVRCPRVPRRALMAVAVAVLVANTVASTDPRSALSEPHTVHLPWLGDSVVTNGAGSIQNYIRGGQVNPGTGQFTRRQGQAWQRSNRQLTRLLNELGPAFVVFGFRHRLVNVNTVQLEQRLADRDLIPLTMVDPIAVPNDEQAMVDYLTTGAAATSCLVLTARGAPFEIEPIVDPDLMARAARASGFVRRTTLELPDRRTVVVWRRPATCPVTNAAGAGA
jgi:4-amino-4-deoxy-L-arabinose transferase-like glycosyltransferase